MSPDVKLDSITLTTMNALSTKLGPITVRLTNGEEQVISSPSKHQAANQTVFDNDEFMRGYSSDDWLGSMFFYDSNGQQSGEFNVFQNKIPLAPVQLAANEELVGVYGSMEGQKGSHFNIASLGFIVKVKAEE